jgi:methylmalonyl-CoA mutase
VDDGAISLTAGFAPADEATWRALVDKTLNGASFEKRLVSKTYDGVEIQPLYTAANASPPLADALRPQGSFDADRAWDIRASVDHPDPGEAKTLLMADLEGGASSLLLRIDPSGQDGVAIASRADLEQPTGAGRPGCGLHRTARRQLAARDRDVENPQAASAPAS